MLWLAHKVYAWSAKKQHQELTDFVAHLQAMDSNEIAMVLAVATHQRHKLEKLYNWKLLFPVIVLAQAENPAQQLNTLIRQIQKEGALEAAAGVMVWLQSIRAIHSLDLRQLGRDMWRELERGMPLCYGAVGSLYATTGRYLDIADFQEFPDGLTPDPL